MYADHDALAALLTETATDLPTTADDAKRILDHVLTAVRRLTAADMTEDMRALYGAVCEAVQTAAVRWDLAEAAARADVIRRYL